jgi:hypothetical protein
MVRLLMLVMFPLFCSIFVNAHCQELKGSINAEMLKEFEEFSGKNQLLTFSSQGGRADYAARIADIIIENNLNLLFINECQSACAEYIIVTQNPFRIFKDSLIGYHHNPVLVLDAAVSAGLSEGELKERRLRAATQRRLYQRMGISTDIWRVQSEAIGLKFEKVSRDGRDHWEMRYTNVAWMPTSAELSALLGREIEMLGGPICNDDPECLQKRIDGMYAEGLTVMTGFGVMTSQGPGPAAASASETVHDTEASGDRHVHGEDKGKNYPRN